MTIHLTDPEVVRLAAKLAERRNITEVEAIRQALEQEVARSDKDDYVERAVAFAREIRALGDPALAQPIDKAFIDSLYED